MKIATERTKDIFMRAARQGRAMHLLVHFDEGFYDDSKHDEGIQRAYIKIKALLKTLSPAVPTAYATLFPYIPFFKLGDNDFHVEDHVNASALDVPLVQNFIQENSISLVLISGYALLECIKDAVNSALEQGLIPLVIADATDTRAAPESDSEKDKSEYIRIFETLFDDDYYDEDDYKGEVHIANVEDVQDWMQELDAEDYTHS